MQTRAPKGTYRDPAKKHCFDQCMSCFRCANKEKLTYSWCNGCSGRPDVEGIRVPHIDDTCRCAEGVMQWITKRGELLIRRFETDPFGGSVRTDARSEDDRDWNAFVNEKREQYDNPLYDPIVFDDGSGSMDYHK